MYSNIIHTLTSESYIVLKKLIKRLNICDPVTFLLGKSRGENFGHSCQASLYETGEVNSDIIKTRLMAREIGRAGWGGGGLQSTDGFCDRTAESLPVSFRFALSISSPLSHCFCLVCEFPFVLDESFAIVVLQRSFPLTYSSARCKTRERYRAAT